VSTAVFEETFKLNRTILFKISAMVAVALAPLAAAGQVNPEAAPGPEQGATYKYEAYAGAAYTRFAQATESFSGLVGGKASLARDWGKYFQLTGSVDYYRLGTGHANLPSPGDPSIYTVMIAPGVHANIYGNLSGEVFGELGGEHTGGEEMKPNISFAGGFGVHIARRYFAERLLDAPHMERTRNHRRGVPVLRDSEQCECGRERSVISVQSPLTPTATLTLS
jgi:hypothetical protein